MTTTIEVGLRDRAYAIHVGRGLLERVSAHLPVADGAERAAVVTQRPVAEHHLDALLEGLAPTGLDVEVIEIPDGESAKNLATYGELQRRLAHLPLSRQDLLIALGGGVIGDLTGFVAATYNRGIGVVQVPTTLLAQVDAAIGGKTGVNLPEGKNLVGAFHQPLTVLCDVDTLDTLPSRVRAEGLGEVVKYGLIRDPDILRILEQGPSEPDLETLEDLVRRSAAVKAAVVAADERESGERAHLNLGHTYGHAVEALTGYADVLHGEAVAIGMCVALRLGVRMGLTPEPLVERTESVLEHLGLPTSAPRLDRSRVWQVMARDKKARGGVRFVVLDDLARPTLVTPTTEDVDAAIDEVEVGT